MAPPNPFKTLNNAVASGPGAADHLNQVYSTTTMIVEVSDFSGSQLDVQLQASHDGINWLPVATVIASSDGVFQVTFTGAILWTRGYLLLLSGSTATVNATVASA